MGRRRGNGEGSIRQRKNGSWQASVMIGYKPDGRRDVRHFTGRTKIEAKNKLNAYLNDKASCLRVDEDYTLSNWLDIFIEHHKHNIKPVTYINYQHMLRIIKEHLGSMTLQSIKPLHIESFLRTLIAEGRSPSVASKCKALLFMALERAEANDLVRRNAARLAESPRKIPPKKQPCFTKEEMRILMRNLPDDRIGHSIRILLSCGLRTQELLALTPEHISPEGDKIIINQAVSMVRGTVTISTPKSQAGYRTVPVPPHAIPSAIYLRNTDADYIWSVDNPEKPANPSTFRTAYRKAIDAIPGVRCLSPHACRRAYISLMQAQHVDIATLQALVGHNSLKMTQHYLTIHPSIQLEAATKFSEAFCEDIPSGDSE